MPKIKILPATVLDIGHGKPEDFEKKCSQTNKQVFEEMML